MKRGIAALLLVAAVSAGCRRVIALGDSNTCTLRPCDVDTWTAELERRIWYRGWKVVNRGQRGMTAGTFYFYDGRNATTDENEPATATFHLERLLRDEHLGRACRWWPSLAPVVVIAVGSNDIIQHTSDVVAEDILALEAHVHDAAPCIRVLVALVPPRIGVPSPTLERIASVNEVLRARLPADRLVDFQTGFGPEDFVEDGAHVSASGRVKQAEAVRRTLLGAR